MADYAQVEMTTTTSSADVNDATETLVDDINQLYQDMYNVGLTDEALKKSTDTLGTQSSDPYGSCWITLVTQTMSLDCNLLSGVMVCLADTMNILSDIRNLTTLSNNSYMSMASQSSDPSYKGSQAQIDDMNSFEDSLDVLNEMSFMIVNPDGSSTPTTPTTGGIIGLLSNPDYWPMGKAPMSEQTSNILNTDIDGIEGFFSSWGNESSMYDQIDAWSNPAPDSDGIVTTNETTSLINNDFSSMGDAIDSDTNKLSAELQVAMTEYQSFQDTWEQIMQYLADWNNTALQGMGA